MPEHEDHGPTSEMAADEVMPTDEESIEADSDSPSPSVPEITRSRTHDPRRVIEDLRDHLAAHDRSLAFLLGAGTSCAITVAPAPNSAGNETLSPLIPGIDALTTICQNAVSSLGTSQAEAWLRLASQCASNNQRVNIENILSRVRSKLDAIGDGETLIGLDRDALKQVEGTICSTIAKNVIPDEARIPDPIPHDDFVKWVHGVHRTAPLEIFTTNYDILFERACERASVPIFDGFAGAHEPFFYADSLDDDDLLPHPKWIRLWKLHGSVNWKAVDIAGRRRIVRGRPDTTGEMILPSHRKYDESRKQPYTSFIERLARVLRREHALLVTSGYGFRDEHINAVLYGSLDGNPTANIIALWFDELSETDNIVTEARRRPNLCVIGPNGGVFSGVFGLWRLNQPVNGKTHTFMDSAFDSNANPDESGSRAAATDGLDGRMRLGDFKWFCRFLSEMGGSVT